MFKRSSVLHRIISRVVFSLPHLLLPLLAVPTYAQTGSQTSETLRVILGEDTMIPGYPVTVPCELEVGGDVKVGKIELEVTFPTAKVSFDSVRRGLISDQIDAQISYEVQKNETDAEFSTITLSVAPRERIPIPQGFLFDLVFNISKEMSTDDVPVVLKNNSRAYSVDESSTPLANLETKDGLIRVVAEPPPVASCFFYMH